MKQLHKQSTALPYSQPLSAAPYSPKSGKHHRSLPRSLGYILKEQRLRFILIGVVIGPAFFFIYPSLSTSSDHRPSVWVETHDPLVRCRDELACNLESYFGDNVYDKVSKWVGWVLVGIGAKRKKIVVICDSGFVSSHLVDKLIARGDDMIVIDNFFIERKENVAHLLGNPRFELIRHDVVEPILLEVDQIYHLACPTSSVHYKYNPVFEAAMMKGNGLLKP